MQCPSMKTLQQWLDGYYQLEEGTLSHIRTCSNCILFIEKFCQSPELDAWLPKKVPSSFGGEAEFKELQIRLREWNEQHTQECSRYDVNTLQNFSVVCNAPSDFCMAEDDKAEPPSSSARVSEEGELPIDLNALQRVMPDQRYQLQRILGRGGCGFVVLAYDVKLGREVAVKFLVRNSELERQRLRREGRILAEMDHPNVVRILDVGEIEKHQEQGVALFLVMEYIGGGSAAEHVWDGESSYRDLASMLVGVAKGMQAAHQQGLVHRDLKPSNLLYDAANRLLKVADFGLAKHVGDSATLVTRTGDFVGTPEYMSPEQILGALESDSGVSALSSMDVREFALSDVYSLGATLYAFLTQRPPFVGSPLAILRQIPEVQPVAPSILSPTVPRALELICLHAMEKIPARRYPSMRAFADDLQRFVDGRPIHAKPPVWHRIAIDWCSRNKALASTLILFVLSLVTGVFGTTWMWWKATQQANETAKYANSLEVNRNRLRESVSRFQQRIFADEAMHWQMTDSFRREMFVDVISYLDEFSELIADPGKDPSQFQQLITDYLMVSKAARDVGGQVDAIVAADRAVALIQRHEAGGKNLGTEILYLQYQAISAACRARLPLPRFLDTQVTCDAIPAFQRTIERPSSELKILADRCMELLTQIPSPSNSESTDILTLTENHFCWEMARRESVLFVTAGMEPGHASKDKLVTAFSQCLQEIERGGPPSDGRRLLLIGELGWELGWYLSSFLESKESIVVLEQSEMIIGKMRNTLRSLEMPLTFSDWQLGLTQARKSLLLSLQPDLVSSSEVAKIASASFEKAIEMRPQNRKWIEESVRLELFRSDWLVQQNELDAAASLLTNLIKKKLRLSKSAPNDYEQRKQIVKLFVKLADLSLKAGHNARAREEYYVAAQDCRIILMNPSDQQWVLDVRPWLLSQVIKLDEDRKFRDGPLKHEARFTEVLDSMGLDSSAFDRALKGQMEPDRPSGLEPASIMHSLLQN